jgi:hypothetical protein
MLQPNVHISCTPAIFSSYYIGVNRNSDVKLKPQLVDVARVHMLCSHFELIVVVEIFSTISSSFFLVALANVLHPSSH